MFIRRARFENFTVFENAEFEFCSGLNVLIGKNGTGKSHVLKAMYGLAEGSRRAHLDIDHVRGRSLRSITAEASKKTSTISAEVGAVLTFLAGTLSAEYLLDFQNLLKRKRKDSVVQSSHMLISILMSSATESLSVEIDNGNVSVSSVPSKSQLTGSAIYIPPREVLSMYPGFIELYEKYRLPFERTYYELCRALSGLLLREVPPILAELAKPLEAALGGRVVMKGNRFVIEHDGDELDINFEADGLRKFAMLLHLIANGSIEPGGCLFWDEPEANLNPKLVVTMKDFLIGLAKAGVQVFMASHDYLLCRELSLEAEYGKQPELIRFFCLNRDSSTDPVTVESGAILADLHHNPIVEEFTAHYEREARLFSGAPLQKEA